MAPRKSEDFRPALSAGTSDISVPKLPSLRHIRDKNTILRCPLDVHYSLHLEHPTSIPLPPKNGTFPDGAKFDKSQIHLLILPTTIATWTLSSFAGAPDVQINSTPRAGWAINKSSVNHSGPRAAYHDARIAHIGNGRHKMLVMHDTT